MTTSIDPFAADLFDRRIYGDYLRATQGDEAAERWLAAWKPLRSPSDPERLAQLDNEQRRVEARLRTGR